MTSKSSIVELASLKRTETIFDDNRIEKGMVKVGTKPSDVFRGIWGKSKKRISANEVREQSWQKSK